MGNAISNLWNRFLRAPLLNKFIALNVAVFVVIQLIYVGLVLFNEPTSGLLRYLQLPSNLHQLLRQPWTLLSYMFVHRDVWHILFNMVWFLGFGRLFVHFFNEKQLGGLYFLGGVTGAIFYLVAFNTFPYFVEQSYHSYLLGASASVMAVVVATAVYAPNYKVRLLLLGAIPLKYIALATIGVDAMSIVSTNAGGHIAHLGGACAGALFALQLAKGKDITRPLNRFIDSLVNLFKPRPPRMKVKVNKAKRESDGDYNQRKHAQLEEMDAILDKVKQLGYGGLSASEKRKLFDLSDKK